MALLCASGLAAAQEGTDPSAPEVPRFEQPPSEPPSEPPPPAPVEAPPEVPAPEEPELPPGERRPTRMYQDEEGVSVISNRDHGEPATTPPSSADAAAPAAAPSEPAPEPAPAPSEEPAPLPSSRPPAAASLPEPPSRAPLFVLAGLVGLVGLIIVGIFFRRR